MITDSRAWQALRLSAFARSGGRCQCRGECGRHAEPCPTRLHPGPGGFHADHILPRSPADPSIPPGPDAPANIRALCPACNRAKSNRVTTLPEGPIRHAMVAMLRAQLRLAAIGVATRPLPEVLRVIALLPPERRASARPWVIAPHVVTLRIWPVEGHESLTTKARAAIDAAVGRPGARVYQHGAEWRVEVPRAPRGTVALAEMPAWGIGLDAMNRPLALDLAASPGVLLAGQTGGGKSTALQTIIYHVARAGGRLVILDPKYRAGGAALRPFRRLAALECAVANSAAECADALALAASIMDARDPGESHPMLAVVVDEIHELDLAARGVVERMAKLGREVNVQVVAATQHPIREVVTNALKNQLTNWIAGRVQNASASTLVVGRTGAQYLAGRGDMIVVSGGRDSRIQVALGGAPDWARLATLPAEPQRAPESERADPRYVRGDVSEKVAYLVDRWEKSGVAPSTPPIQREFGGSRLSNQRARDVARAIIGLPA